MLRLYTNPYLLTAISGSLAAFFYFQNAEVKMTTIFFIPMILGALIIFVNSLMKKANIVPDDTLLIILNVISICNFLGYAKYDITILQSLMMTFLLSVCMYFQYQNVNKIFSKNNFTELLNENPDYLHFRSKDSLFSIVKKYYKKYFNFSKVKINEESEKEYYYIFNNIEFNTSGIKGVASFDMLKKFIDESGISVKDINKEDIKTIEMMYYK